MWRSYMFWRLFIGQAILILAAISVLGLVVVRRVENRQLEEIRGGLHAQALMVRELVRDRPHEDLPRLQKRLVELDEQSGVRVTLLADDGRVLADAAGDPARLENHADRPEVQAAKSGGFAVSTRFSSTVGESMMYGALRTGSDAQAVAVVRVALPLERVRAEVHQLRSIVWSTVAGTAVGSLVLALWLTRRITRPVEELTRAAEEIGKGDVGRTVYAVGADEIGQLAQTFNHMSGQLAVQFAQLHADQQQMRTILSAMVEGVIALDADQRILFANDCAAELFEFPLHTAKGRRLWEVVRHRALHEVVARALSRPEPCQQELNWTGAGARSLTAHVVQLPTALDGEPRGAVLVLHDTTDLRRLERLRQDFVANVSHELKTPLSVIKVCVETLLDGAVEDADHRGPFLERISEQADRLHALILDLLSLARIEAGAEVFEFKALPLAPVIAACIERHLGRAQARGQILSAEEANSVDPAVWADEEAISEILDNLVDNALKYTPDNGRIFVRSRVESGQVCIEVEDTGIGIPEQDLPRIFERFYRVDKARSRALGGTGLGLSIVKHLAQAMHGHVSASSRVGHGTTFVVRLPCATATEIVGKPAPGPSS